MNQGILSEGEGPEGLTSSYLIVQIGCFSYWNYI